MVMQSVLDQIGPVPVGPIAYGTWRLEGDDPSAAGRNVRTAIDLGMTLIDTADIYGLDKPGGFGSTEIALGELLSADPALREQMVLSTKGGIAPPTPYNSSQDYLITACEASLKRLKTDRIDLYHIHRPDLLAHPADVAAALEKLYNDGKVRSFGVSNYTIAQTNALLQFLEVPFLTFQPEFSAWEMGPIEDGELDMCMEYDLTCLAWSPLAGGALATGSPREDDDVLAFHRVITALDKLAKEHDATRTQIALAFLMRHPARVIPIIGTQSPQRIEEAAFASKIALGRKEWYSIIEARLGTNMP